MGRRPPGQRGRVASSPASLLQRDHLLPPLGVNFGSEGCEGGGFGEQEGVPLGSASSGQRDRERVSCGAARWEDERGGHRPWWFFPSQTPPASGAAFRREGRGLPAPAWGFGSGFFVGFCCVVLFFSLGSCARTLALCRVFVCVCKTRAEDTPKLWQRHCRVIAPMDQKTRLLFTFVLSDLQDLGRAGGVGGVF